MQAKDPDLLEASVQGEKKDQVFLIVHPQKCHQANCWTRDTCYWGKKTTTLCCSHMGYKYNTIKGHSRSFLNKVPSNLDTCHQ